MHEYQWLINQRAAEKYARMYERVGERDRFVMFDEWLQFAHPEVYGRWDDQTRTQRNKLYREYQEDMIHMGFCEWQRARTIPGVSPVVDLYG